MSFSNDAQKIKQNVKGSTNVHIGTIDATGTTAIMTSGLVDDVNLRIRDVTLTTPVGTAKHGSNYWAFNIVNVTDTDDLLATAATTRDITAGIAITANEPYKITPTQNANIGTGKALQLSVTKTGSPSDLTGCLVTIHWERVV